MSDKAVSTASKSAGMVVSLPGLLLRAADDCDRFDDSTGRGFMLRTLFAHLTELRANPERIGEFFELYVDDREQPKVGG